MKRLLAVLILFFSFEVSAEVAPAPDSSELFSRIWSPFCHGISLLECPSSQAEDLRKEIRVRMKAGESEEVVFADLNKQYNGTLRMEPSRNGREALAYWIPWTLLLLTGTFVISFWLFRKQKFKKVHLRPSTAEQNSKVIEDLKSRL